MNAPAPCPSAAAAGVPFHVAIIMDGNGRWATGRGLPRTDGHKAGAGAVRRVVEAALALEVRWLTLFAFSSDNWNRPPHEVATLLELFADYLRTQVEACVEHGIQVSVAGRRDRLGPFLGGQVERAERETRHGRALRLRLAIDYSARDAILMAAWKMASYGEVSNEVFSRILGEGNGAGGAAPDVDLLIRTGGEQRLSDFMLWECAYAELVFIKVLWPDFQRSDLEAALREFRGRERRFGRVPVIAAP